MTGLDYVIRWIVPHPSEATLWRAYDRAVIAAVVSTPTKRRTAYADYLIQQIKRIRQERQS